ncbi:hypothetical protein DV515_00017667 [Chloebia gouldiae]|uniref:Uncharacterized protein n=1 Tax=Chloebia gouldiae TaxID=44316 RepID=A0A3L8Q9R6_CHLGU|nr:hypothetical protein DV515_00017667 [Chloebia gouldiae]
MLRLQLPPAAAAGGGGCDAKGSRYGLKSMARSWSPTAWPLQRCVAQSPLSPRCSLPQRVCGDDTWRLTPVGQHQPNTLPTRRKIFQSKPEVRAPTMWH